MNIKKQDLSTNKNKDRLDFKIKEISKIPGPGSYNPPSDSILSSSISYTIKSKVESDYSSITSNIQLFNLPKLDSSPKFTIQKRDELFYYIQSDAPSPNCLLPSTLKQNNIKIGSKLKNIFDTSISPGPGQYNPFNLRRKSYTSMDRFVKRDEIWKISNDSPGPASYDPVPPPPRPRRWTNFLKNSNPHLPIKLTKRFKEGKLRSNFQFIHI